MDYPKSTPSVGLVGGKFVDENVTTGTPGSLIPAAWGNAVTDEVLAVIKAAGIVPAEGDLSQLLKAIQAIAASDIKRSVRVATTGPIALSGLQTIDAVALKAGDRVLAKDQANASQNWIYTVASGAWVRALDANESSECTPGHLVIVEAGTAHGGSLWQLSNTTLPTLGTTALTFVRVFGKTGVAAGDYRKLTVDLQGRVIGGSNPSTVAEYGLTDVYTRLENDQLLLLKAPLASPVFTGAPKVPTPVAGSNDTSAASTAFVVQLLASLGLGTVSATAVIADMDDATVPSGSYYVNSSTLNSKGPGKVLHFVYGGAGFQLYSLYGARGNLYWRTRQSSIWSAEWYEVARLESPAFVGSPTAPTAAKGTNTKQLANCEFVLAEIAALVASSPAALDTLKELADALGNDPNFATTMTNLLALKAPLASPTFTGVPKAPTAAAGTNTVQLSTCAFVMTAIANLLTTINTTLLDPWATQPIGVPIPLFDGSSSVPVPSKDKGYRYIKLTAGDAYNDGVLTGELVSGTAPTLIAYASINLAGSPMHTHTVYLINTERRVLRAGQPNIVENDQLQGHTVPSATGNGSNGPAFDTWPNGAVNTTKVALVTDGVNGTPRVGNETRAKNIGVTYYMRIL